jgi:hypothetical protein
MVPDLGRIVVNAAAGFLDDLFETHGFKLSTLLQVVKVDHVSVVVLAVVVFEGLLAVMRSEGVYGVRQGWEAVFHGVFLEGQ